MITSQQQVPEALSSDAPAVATDGKTYFLAWKGQSDQTIWWTSCPATTGQNSYDWAPQKQIPNAASSAGPALTCLNGKVWIAWKGEDKDTRIFLASLEDSTWSPGVPVSGIGTSTAPALGATWAKDPSNSVQFPPMLFLSWKGESDDQIYLSKSSDGNAWSQQAKVPGALSSDTPALIGYNGALTIAWKGASDNSIWWGGWSGASTDKAEWGGASIVAADFLTSAGPALAVDKDQNIILVWKGQSDATVLESSFNPSIGTWTPQTRILVIDTADRPAMASQYPAVSDILLAWKGSSTDKIWCGLPSGLLSVQEYTFNIPSFHISNMRTGHAGIKDGTDTDYVSIGVQIKGQPEIIQTASVGDQTGGDVKVGLSIPNLFIADSDQVYFHYGIINSGAGQDKATAAIKSAATTVLNALEKADEEAIKQFFDVDLSGLTPQEAGALLAAQFGETVLPGLGVVIGIAALFFNDIVGWVFPDCDGPVAAGAYAFSGAQLRAKTNSPVGHQFLQVDENPGVNSAGGCGSNSNYQVTWTVTNLSA
jgi:hypothetical protein